MSFFDFNKVAQTYPLQGGQQAGQLPFTGGAPMWPGGQQAGQGQPYMGSPVQGGTGPHQQGGMGQGRGMMMQNSQQPFGGQALGGTQMPQMPQGVEGMTDIERRQLAEAQAMQSGKFADFGMQSGQDAKAPPLQQGGMSRLMAMSNRMGGGQQQRQPYQRMNTGIKGLL